MNRQPSVVSWSSRGPRSHGASGLGHDVRRAGHRLDAAADEHVAVADGDRVGRRVDRLQAGAAQPVDGQPADLDREAGQEQRHPGDVAVVLAGLVGAAEDDVLDERRVDARRDRRRRAGRGAARSSGRTARERAAVAADRRADGLDDPRLAERAVEVTGHAADCTGGGRIAATAGLDRVGRRRRRRRRGSAASPDDAGRRRARPVLAVGESSSNGVTTSSLT